MKKHVIVTGLILTLSAIPCVVSAAPVVNGVLGSVSHGKAITVTGSGFGTHSNYNTGSNAWKGVPYLTAAFKDFEDNSTLSQGFSVNYASDISIQSGGPANSTNYEKMIYNGSRLANYGINQSGNNTNSVYTSFWFMMPSGTEGGKPWRWYFGPNTSYDNLYLATSCGSSAINLGGDVLANNGQMVYGGSISPSVWHKLEIYASQSSNTYKVWVDGALYLDFASRYPGVSWSSGGNFSPNGHSLEYPDMIDGTTTGCSTTGSYNFDDIYIDYTPARVEICTGSTWANRGVCNTQLPTSWGTSSAGIVVNQGSFPASSTRYLYVVDSSNSASNGLSVTFGATGSGSSTPSAPSGLTVTPQ